MNDGSLTIWQVMGGANRDLMSARPVIPAFIALVYGLNKFFHLGSSAESYLTAYAMTCGGAASIGCIMLYSTVGASSERSIFAMLVGFSGLIPYSFALYLMAVPGCNGIWQSLNPFSIWGIGVGFLWIVLGHRLLRKFWIITELMTLSVSQEGMGELLFSKLGMSPKELSPLLADVNAATHVLNSERQA